jgi:hypothetical protein
MRTVTIVLMLLATSFAGAAPEADVAENRIEAELLILNQERDALLQRFRLARELRGDALPRRTALPGAAVLSAPMINYDDMVRDAAIRRAQIERADAELARLYDESVTLSDLDRLLREQLRELVSLHRQ